MAAQNAATRFAYLDTIQLLQHALKLVPRINSNAGAELEVEVLEFLGDAHYAHGAMAESAKAYEAGALQAARAGLKAVQVAALTSLVRPFGLIDPKQGMAAIDRAVKVSESLGDPLILARTYMLAAGIRLVYDRWSKEDAERCAAAYQTICDLGEAGPPSYHIMMYAHVQALQGKYQEAFKIFEAGSPSMDDSTALIATFLQPVERPWHFFAWAGLARC